jgi:hypothetical protein
MLEVEIYRCGSITFILYPSKTYVTTKLQTLILIPKESYYYKRLEMIRYMIRIGKVKSISDVCYFSDNKVQLVQTGACVKVLAVVE